MHSNVYGLQSVLDQLKGMDTILCAGDLVGYYPFVNEALDLLRRKNVQCILGNHDAYLLGLLPPPENPNVISPLQYAQKHISPENMKFLKDIGTGHREVTIDGLHVTMFHGSPWDEFEEYIFPDFSDFQKFKKIRADVVILGHTHYSMVRHVESMVIVNPGSCGQPRDWNPAASYAVLDTSTKEVVLQRASYDVEIVCERARQEGFPEYVVQVLQRRK